MTVIQNLLVLIKKKCANYFILRLQTLVNRCSMVEELFEFSNEKLAGIFYVHDDDELKKKKLDGQYKRLRAARNIVKDYVGMYHYLLPD